MSQAASCVLTAFHDLLALPSDQIDSIGQDTPIPTFSPEILIDLCEFAIKILKNKHCYVEFTSPVYVVGDIHGNIFDLIRILIYSKLPPTSKYVFLGDYVDRGEFSVEVCALLLSLYCTFPNYIVLLRGNHEFMSINGSYGFYDEVKNQYQDDYLFRLINSVFNWLPIWAIINHSFFCVHGGISPNLQNLDQIKEISRPCDTFDDPIIRDLVWSDPSTTCLTFDSSQRGTGVLFGATAIDNFLSRTGLQVILRGHQCVLLGISKFADGKLYTIFSSSRYEELRNNRAGVLFISPSNQIELFSLPPTNIIPREETNLKLFNGYVQTILSLEKPHTSSLSMNIQLSENKMKNHSMTRLTRNRKLFTPKVSKLGPASLNNINISLSEFRSNSSISFARNII